MLQNKLLFNQSAVSLEIIGLPDYSNNENNNQISIISQWRLTIIDKPHIEGNIDHLRSIMDAFYSYSNFLINNEIAIYESKLIDIKAENFFTHKLRLKSSKPDVKPLNIEIGNSVLSDIINCFDQFNNSPKVRNIFSNSIKNRNNRKFFSNLISREKIINIFLPPIISLCTIFLVSSPFVYYYNNADKIEKKTLFTPKNLLIASNI